MTPDDGFYHRDGSYVSDDELHGPTWQAKQLRAQLAVNDAEIAALKKDLQSLQRDYVARQKFEVAAEKNVELQQEVATLRVRAERAEAELFAANRSCHEYVKLAERYRQELFDAREQLAKLSAASGLDEEDRK